MSFKLPLAPTATRLLVSRADDEPSSDCVTAVPGHNGNVPISSCNSYYNYDPQVAPAVAVAVLFAIFFSVHVFEGFFFKKRYTWVLIMGALWETLGFIIHSLGAKDQQNISYATAWNILFLLAPLWINAFVYMTFARMVHFWHPEGKVIGVSARVISLCFVLADIISFIIQGAGGIMASPGADPNIIKTGLNIYLGGMGLQQFFIVAFCGLMVAFQMTCARFPADPTKPAWKPCLYAMYGALVCITVRIIFRIAEFARGITPDNPVPFHEEYTYALDCFPMMVCLLILAVWHPGRYLVGPDSEFPKKSRKQKKAEKAEKKEAKREKKEAEKKAKELAKMGRSHV